MRRRITLADLAEGVIDAVTSHICVLDTDGTIIAVNRAWSQYGAENSPKGARSDIGANYLAICDVTQGAERADAAAFGQGINSVLSGVDEYGVLLCDAEWRPTGFPC